jgi:hypothetical protein
MSDSVAFRVPMKLGRYDRWEIETHDRIIALLNEFREQTAPAGIENIGTHLGTVADEIAGQITGISRVMKP